MRPLDRLTVLDLTRVLSGPYCTMMLADMGARVIKIERPDSGDDTRTWGPPFVGGESSYFFSINRNKESVAIDFKHPDGRRLLDAATALLTYQAGVYFTTGQTPSRTGNRHPSIAPYDTFPTEDGTLVLAVGNDRQWQMFCRVIGQPSLATDARFETNPERVAHYDILRPALTSTLKTRSRQEWIDRLVPAGVPCAAVRALDEALTDPQLIAREMVEVLQHPSAGALRVLGIPVKLSDTPGAVQTPSPRLGEHTASVLRDLLDVPTEEISRLARDHVVGVAVDA